MRRLIIKLLVLITPMAALFAVLYLMPYFLPLPYSSSHYLAASIDKERRLRETPSPKIIFIGGSNLSFGLDSGLIERETGLPVVNMGLVTGLPPDLLLNEIRPFVGRGDLVVASLEYGNFCRYGGALRNPFLDPGDKAVAGLIFVNPAAAGYLAPGKRCRALLADLAVLARLRGGDLVDSFARDAEWVRTSRGEPTLYRRAFNPRGDLTAYLDLAPPAGRSGTADIPQLPGKTDRAALDLLNRFQAFAASKGARTFLVFPSLSETAYRADRERIESLYRELQGRLYLEILGPPSDYVFADSLCWDTCYHLGREGRKIRTGRIIAALKNKTAPGRPGVVK